MTGFLFLLALTSLSASPLFVKAAHAPVEFLGFWRLTLAALFIAIYLAARQRFQIFKLSQQQLLWSLCSGFLFFLHLWTYVFSAQNTSVAHLVILFSTNPIFTTLGAAWFFREKLKKRLLIVYPLAFTGIWIIAHEKVSHHESSQIGDIMAVVSAALHAGYLLASKQARRNLPNLEFSLLLYISAGLLFGLSSALRDNSSLSVYTAEAWLSILGLIIFPTFLGHALMTHLVNKIELSLLSCGKLIEPGLSSGMAYFFFHEALGIQAIFAFALTATAVLILFWPKKWSGGLSCLNPSTNNKK